MTRRALPSVAGAWLVLVPVVLLALTGTRGWAADPSPATFASPEQAVDALVVAVRHTDLGEVRRLLGREGRALIWSGDRVADRLGRDRFIAAYDHRHRLDLVSPTRAVLVVGAEAWPFPIPVVHGAGSWRFDTAAGIREILDRRIGRNELNVIEVSRAFVVAQRDYAARDPLGTGLREYAQRLLSTPGGRDGLYWPAEPGEPESPLGPLVAIARAEGYGRTPPDQPTPYHGYYYRLLTRQGPGAPGGARDYIVGGHMTGGFALLAFPARYGNSGVMTFLVNQNGIVYQKNLGPDTPATAERITEFDPDATWTTP